MSSGIEHCIICGKEFQAWDYKDGHPFKESDICEHCRKTKTIQPLTSIQLIPPVGAQFTMKDIRYKVIASDRLKGIFTAKRIRG